ncbi:DUF4286 family protein [Legionella sp. 16cNR16C]|uniref:DUF4286 family protein n=1 Tax=Legionella sp. 16cNR16C TaxID=2905656 RepID=UPI001E4571CA|nr:DUF4286 family protein [Legionella sp. 16cNR16C]MCE3043959.1 DUF4286 family protein [Legionella sp. 16cNR16C]
MVIYEVNLAIDSDIYPQYQEWLKKHAEEMVQLPGFIKAKILRPEGSVSGQEKLTVQYQLESRAALNQYFTDFAPKMRGDGLARFEGKFSAERKVFEVQHSMKK